jgi:hypothetical protein
MKTAGQRQILGTLLIAAFILVFIVARYWRAINFHVR